MATKKITINELRSIVKQIIKEERMLNEAISDISDTAVNLLMDKSKYMTKPGSSKGVYVVYDLSLPKGKNSFNKDDDSTQIVGYWWTKDSAYKKNKFESDHTDTIKKLLALSEVNPNQRPNAPKPQSQQQPVSEGLKLNNFLRKQ